jgi:hypothetical protein
MKPLSRGCPPEEFTLRVPCSLSQQFTLSDLATPHNFEVEGVHCTMELINSTLELFLNKIEQSSKAQHRCQ